MRKRSLTIEWRVRPTADGSERLVLAMKMLFERATEDPKEDRRMESEPCARPVEARIEP